MQVCLPPVLIRIAKMMLISKEYARILMNEAPRLGHGQTDGVLSRDAPTHVSGPYSILSARAALGFLCDLFFNNSTIVSATDYLPP
mmetsp:Transcript_29402/g.90114  ORF Transcript_29402/g.90114 Transcript_29402/m.90114 type:complete len:86 (+) Transcript_29402:1062-1319(+)|eukprot:scaffold164624_cov31-Tisochrysis_lutea.AAC.2